MIKLFLFLLAIIPTSVFANEYKYSDVKIEANEKREVVLEKLYKFYEVNDIYTDEYYLEGENPSEYPYISDIMTTKRVSNSFEKPEEKLNRTIIEKKVQGYNYLKKIKRIVIKDIITGKSSRNLNITEIEIYNNDKKLDYDYYCFECNNFAQATFNNKKNDDKDSSVSFKSVIDLRLREEYYPEDLKIVIYFKENSKFNFSFNTYFYDNSVEELFIYNAIYPKYDYIIKKVEDSTAVALQNNTFIGSINIKIDKNSIINYKWDTDKVVVEKDDKHFFTEINNVTVYDYEDILFKYYKQEKNYLKGYYLEMPEYQKDDADYTIRYKYREKEEIKEQKNEEKQNICNEKEIVKTTIPNEKIKEKIVYSVDNNNEFISKITKFRHLIIAIIILVLSLMIYTVHSLRKE